MQVVMSVVIVGLLWELTVDVTEFITELSGKKRVFILGRSGCLIMFVNG